MKQLCIAVVATLIAGGMAMAGDPVHPEEVGTPATWGTSTSVVHVRNLWLGGQPDETALQTARTKGVAVVINVREPGESSWDEKSAAENLGMTYYNVPITRDGPFSAEQFAAIDALVEGHESSEILIHCSTGNRAAAWFGAHLVGKHAMTEEAALDAAQAAGMTKPETTEKLRTHLHSRVALSAAGPGASPLQSASDARTPLPLPAMMADHQKQSMREHLAAVQAIIAALGRDDMDGVAKASARIGYSESMGQMCEHMGAAAPGFTPMALNFHHTADTIAEAAQRGDRAGVLTALERTLQTCIGCHATYRQEVVDEATWKRLTAKAAAPH